MATLAAGGKAPDFALPTDSGVTFRLSEQKGRPVVLYFYPEDDTGGCTIENLEFTARAADFEKLGAALVGISPDGVDAHCRFRDKYALRTTLAADPGLEVHRKYGVWGPKKLFGHEYDGVIRTTFLIGPNGRIAQVWKVTRIKGHAESVLEAARVMAAP